MATSPNPPEPLDEAAAFRVTTRTVLFVFAFLGLIWLVVQLRAVLVQVLLAVILSAGMAPLVTSLTAGEAVRRWRWRPPRALVVLGLYIALIGGLAGLGSLLFPPLFHEIEDLVGRMPAYAALFERWLESLPVQYPGLPIDLSGGLAGTVRAAALQLSGLLGQALVVVRFAFGLLGWSFSAILTLILALYITSDSSRILRYLLGFLPLPRRRQAELVASHIGVRLGGWVRGQILLSGIIGLLTLIGLSVLGVRYAVLLAIIAAIGEVVPLVGPIVSAVPAVIIAFVASPTQGLLTVGLYVLIQQLENHLIVPRVMSRAVELHPLAVMLALLAGSELMGVAGAILAVPVTAAISVVVDEIRRERFESETLAGAETRESATSTH